MVWKWGKIHKTTLAWLYTPCFHLQAWQVVDESCYKMELFSLYDTVLRCLELFCLQTLTPVKRGFISFVFQSIKIQCSYSIELEGFFQAQSHPSKQNLLYVQDITRVMTVMRCFFFQLKHTRLPDLPIHELTNGLNHVVQWKVQALIYMNMYHVRTQNVHFQRVNTSIKSILGLIQKWMVSKF